MTATKRRLTAEQLDRWVNKFEARLFPHQESEEEQESFSAVGRWRMRRTLAEFARFVDGRKPQPRSRRKA